MRVRVGLGWVRLAMVALAVAFGSGVLGAASGDAQTIAEILAKKTLVIGSLVDLPNLSVMVMGLESWPESYATEIGEERLLLSAQQVLGPQLKRLLAAPRGPDTVGAQTNWFDESRQIGVPVAPMAPTLAA